MSYGEAVSQLFQAPHEGFVAERKRLSGELKAAGDKAGAARLAALNRPPVSVWAVNQLWWHEQAGFEQLFAVAARQRSGDREATGAHRQNLAGLRARAAELLQGAGHPASESTLRRVTMTLAALAAAGDFAPDSPGALTADRDPPGFETVAVGGAPEPTPRAERKHEPPEAASSTQKNKAEAEREATASRERAARVEREREAAQRLEDQRRRAAEELEQRRQKAERARRQAEQQRLEAALQSARTELDSRLRAVAQRQKELTAAEEALADAQAAVDAAAARLKAFEAEES